jgi:hypothetical protein
MKVVVFHGSSSKFIFKLERNCVLSNSKFELEILLVLEISRTNAY